MSERASASQATPEGRSVAEWTTLAISVAILALALAAITWLSFGSDSGPTTIAVTPLTDEVRQEGDAWYLPIEVTNEGDRTAEDVVVEVDLDTGQGEPTTAELTFTFLASDEKARGTVIFSSDPASGNLTARPVSFREP